MDDFAGEDNRPIRKTLAGLIRVVDRAVDAVAEAEFAREMYGQPAGVVLVVVLLDRSNKFAVVVLGEGSRDFVFEVEAFSEDQRRQGCTSELPRREASDRQAVGVPRPSAHRLLFRADRGIRRLRSWPRPRE